MRKWVAILGLSILLAMPSHATTEQETPSVSMLDEVVVTASRAAESVHETLAAVTVITRQEIETGQYRSLPEALQRVPGLQFSRSGSVGQLADIYLRGTESNHTLVLVDGIRIGSTTNGRASLQHIPLSQIERIEVVRGPRSTLYGSDAVGGVIHIFTRKGGEKHQGQVVVGGGSLATYEARATFSGPFGASHYSLSMSQMGSQGFDVMENNVVDPWGWPTADEPDDDGYLERAASLRLGHRFSPGNEVEFHALHVTGTTEYDGDWQNETDFLQQVIGLNTQLRPFDFWDVTLLGGFSRDDSKNFKDKSYASKFDTERAQFSWQNNIFLGDYQILTAGLDYYQDELSSSIDFDRDSRDTLGTYLQHQVGFERHSMQVGLRYEDNDQFGNHTTYNLSYGVQLPYEFRLTINYGTAFRAPTFNELYWPTTGNSNLRPEESQSYEAALQQQFLWGYWQLNVFRTDIDNLISGWPAANINRARIDGMEMEAAVRLSKNWHLNLILAFLDPRERDSDLLLPRRAEETVTVNLDGDFGRWRAGMTAIAAGSRYDDPANTTRIAGYAVFSLRAAYNFSDNWLLQGKVENLFDKDYTEVATYNTEGRLLYASLTYEF